MGFLDNIGDYARGFADGASDLFGGDGRQQEVKVAMERFCEQHQLIFRDSEVKEQNFGMQDQGVEAMYEVLSPKTDSVMFQVEVADVVSSAEPEQFLQVIVSRAFPGRFRHLAETLQDVVSEIDGCRIRFE